MTQQSTVLVIDDEPAHRLMVRVVLGDAGFKVLEADNGSSGLTTLRAKPVDVVLLDMRMPGMSGLDVLQKMHEEGIATPVIMLTAFGNVSSAVESMKIGAWDYLTKPTDNDELLAVVKKAAEHVRLTRENRDLKKQIGQLRETRIIGNSPEIRKVVELIEQVGPSEANVLVLGESGTGKELVAQQLHEQSARCKGPLVKVNCAALPENLLESELFGYVRGAFTGAAQDKPGRFQLAGGGTLFLDEIGELPLTLQAKILRALQERIVEPLGGVTPVSIDVRFIAATNRDLPAMIAAGTFREDLYYRLNVLEIRIPPLRERSEDIPFWSTTFLTSSAAKTTARSAPSPANSWTPSAGTNGGAMCANLKTSWSVPLSSAARTRWTCGTSRIICWLPARRPALRTRPSPAKARWKRPSVRPWKKPCANTPDTANAPPRPSGSAAARCNTASRNTD